MLTIQSITKRYRRHTVLRDVSFVLRPGEMLGVAGHNGSGKSTLLSVVAQVLQPDTGDILYEGKSVLGSRAFVRRHIGYVPQHSSLLGDITIDETLRFWQRASGTENDLYTAESPASLMGLEAIQKQRVSSLSGGMQKRLSIAMALLPRPSLLLLDEAMSALDRHYRLQLQRRLEEHCAAGGSVLFCSHDINDLLSLCDGILLLQSGAVAYYGSSSAFPRGAAQLDELMNPRHSSAG